MRGLARVSRGSTKGNLKGKGAITVAALHWAKFVSKKAPIPTM